MIDKELILGLLPPVKNSISLISENQNTTDIINEVINSHKAFRKDYDAIAQYFVGANDIETIENIFDFLKSNVSYQVEGEDSQTTKSLSKLLTDGFGDCKHYATAGAGILDALGFDWNYRFASYNLLSQSPGHVFVIVHLPDKEIWFDPVLEKLDARYPIPFYVKDITFTKKKMALKRLSGLNDAYQQAYGDMPDLAGRGDVEDKSGFWEALKNIGLGALTLLTGGGQNNSGSCPPCPQQQQSMNDFILPAAIGFMIAFAVKKKKK